MKRRFITALLAVSMICCTAMSGCSRGNLNNKSEATAEEIDRFLGIMEIKDSDGNVLVNTDDLLSIDIISEKDSSGTYGIEIKLKEDGAEKFRDATLECLGDVLDLYVNGTLVLSPKVDFVIVDGEMQFSGFDALIDVYSIVNAVKYGGEIEENSLGKETAGDST